MTDDRFSRADSGQPAEADSEEGRQAVERPVDVSIIIIANNVREEVLACLESIARHAGRATVEVIFVDNASSDGTAAAVAAEFPETRIIYRSTNEGVAARNYGLRAARGRVRIFLDSDAMLTPGAVDELVDFLDRRPDVGLVGPRLVYPDGTLQLSARRFPPLLLPLLRRPPLDQVFDRRRIVRRHLMADHPYHRTREVEYVLGACQAFTAEVQELVGEIDPSIFYGPDDADWCLRIRRAGRKVVYHPAATVIHAYRRGSRRRPVSRLALRHLRAYYYFQWKWRRSRRRLHREGRAMDRQAAKEAVSSTESSGGEP
jgi:GT2 family glycosyltransferase